MKKIDDTVLRETRYIAIATILMSCIMEAIYLILHRWNLEVLFGNLLGAAAACFNFLLMGITIQKSLDKDAKAASTQMKLSQSMRMLMLFIVAVLGLTLPCFDAIALLIPLFFPRVAIAFRPIYDKVRSKS